MRDEHGQIAGRVRSAAGLDFFEDEINQAFVQVVAAQARVAVGGEDLKNAAVQFQNREIERAAAQIIDGDFGLFGQFAQAVGQRGGGRLVDDAFDGQTGQFARLFGGVALRVVEIGGHGDDGARDRFAQSGLGVALSISSKFPRKFPPAYKSGHEWRRVTGPAPSPLTG